MKTKNSVLAKKLKKPDKKLKAVFYKYIDDLEREKRPAIVQNILDSFAPFFKAHGGGVELVSLDGSCVTLKVKGRCKGCALAPLTFGMGIEKLLKERLPDVKKIKYIE